MATKYFEIEAATLEEARQKTTEIEVPDGFCISGERIVSNGEPQAVRGAADTIEVAFELARRDVPSSATVVEERVLSDIKTELMPVTAFDEQNAAALAKSDAILRFGRHTVVKAVRLVMTGSQGFLGIGKRPNQYEVEVLQHALVEISYRPRVKISVTVSEITHQIIDEWEDKIARMQATRDVPGLIEALKFRDKRVRQVAVKALWVVGDRRAVKPLLGLISADDGLNIPAPAYALGQMGGAQAVKPLINLLAEPKMLTRKGAALALGLIGDARPVEPLMGLLKPEEEMRATAAEALGRLGDARAVEPLIALLHDSDIRITAMVALGFIGDARAVEPLLEMAVETETKTLWSVLLALELIGDLRAIDLMISMLEHSDALIRIYAMVGLARIGDARAAEPLTRLLNDKAKLIGHYAARALESLGMGNQTAEPDAADIFAQVMSEAGGEAHISNGHANSASVLSEIVINQPPKQVWQFFTRSQNWQKWHTAKLKAVIPMWQAEAEMVFEQGHNTIGLFIAQTTVWIKSPTIENIYEFWPRPGGKTLVSLEMKPQGGAFFNDGGQAQKAKNDADLTKFKRAVEASVAAAQDVDPDEEGEV